jgi:tetratricopeptide (TPR) repeat protein
MKQKYDFLPRRLTKEEIALAPAAWIRVLSNYSRRRKKAINETKPGFNTLLATLMAAIAKQDKHLIDVAIELTKENVPRYIYLGLASSVLCYFGAKEESLAMLREAVKLNPSHTMLLSLAGDTDDLDEKESLAKKVLDKNPKDGDALAHLAYAKYFKGEHEEANRLIDKVLLNELGNVYALEHKGNVYFDKKEYSKALEQYLKIDWRPKPVSLQLKICHCYYLLGMLRKAKKIAKKIQGKVSLAYDLGMEVEKANKLLTDVLNKT